MARSFYKTFFGLFALALAIDCAVCPNRVVAQEEWSVTSASKVEFNVKHMMIANVHGAFTKVQGAVKYDGKDLSSANVEAQISADSINTQSQQRDTHLKSSDFLDAQKYPTIKFVSTKIVPTDSGFDVQGDLTLHGVTKPVTLHANKLIDPLKDATGMQISTTANAKINRKEFGMLFDKHLDNGGAMVGDEIAIELTVDLAKK